VIIRVPLLLQKSVAVIHRLDIAATRTFDPVGEDTSGYDSTFREPIAYDDPVTDTRKSSRRERPIVRIPCQVENLTEERLRELRIGDASVSSIMLVFHRKDLGNLGLLDENQEVVIKKGDRVSALEQYGAPVGTVSKRFADPGLFIHEIQGRSFGFGPSGYDLEVAILSDRREGPQ
jgi:hypothetical protein